jgi:hypothetical protein
MTREGCGSTLTGAFNCQGWVFGWWAWMPGDCLSPTGWGYGDCCTLWRSRLRWGVAPRKTRSNNLRGIQFQERDHFDGFVILR